MHSVISIVAGFDATLLYYDHWEGTPAGYEADIANPVQPSTLVWGDSNPANGDVSTLCPKCIGDVINAGAVITLVSDVPVPRNAANIFFDGRDKIGVSKAVAVTRATWAATPGALLAVAVEVVRRLWNPRWIDQVSLSLEAFPARTLPLFGLFEPLKRAWVENAISPLGVRFVYALTTVVVIFTLGMLVGAVMWLIARLTAPAEKPR